MVVGGWADGEEPKSPLARPQPQAALRAAGEFGQIMKRKLSALIRTIPGCVQPVLETGNRAAQNRGGSPQEKREHYKALLEESLALQEHLRHLTHRILSAQEAERKKISRDLQDEIAQTLLGINVRLLTLKKAAKGNTANLKKEIANTQRLVRRIRPVDQSVRA